MKIRMLVDRSGPDNGIWYPPRGGEIDVPDDVGAAMCEARWAAPVAVAEPVEVRAEPPAPAPEPEGEPKTHKRAHKDVAASGGLKLPPPGHGR